MRVLIVNSFYAPTEIGGAERSVRFIAEQLVSRGHAVRVFTTLNNESSVKDVINGVEIYRCNSRNLEVTASKFHPRLGNRLHHLVDPYRFWIRRHIRRQVHDFKPDVAHTNNLSGLSVAVIDELDTLGIPIVHTLRDYNLLCANNSLRTGDRQCPPQRCLPCRLLSTPKMESTHRVSSVVGNSEFILKKHLSYGLFKNAKATTIYNGFSTNFQVSERQHPLKTGRVFRFGYIGMITPRKGIGLLIDTFLSLYRSRKDIELVVAGLSPDGEEPFIEGLKHKAADAPIKFIGQVPQEDFFAQVDCCVLPSLWDEPLSRVIFESFAFATPIIASSTGGSPELVMNGENGLLFDPCKEGSLLESMINILEQPNLYTRISTVSLSQAFDFHPVNVVDKYFYVFAEAAATKLKQVTP